MSETITSEEMQWANEWARRNPPKGTTPKSRLAQALLEYERAVGEMGAGPTGRLRFRGTHLPSNLSRMKEDDVNLAEETGDEAQHARWLAEMQCYGAGRALERAIQEARFPGIIVSK